MRDCVRAAMLDESGQGMVEYIIIVVIVAILAIVAWRFLGSKVKHKISEVGQSVDKL